MNKVYSSIFFDTDWALQKYYGWKQVHDEPSFKVLSKKRGPLKRFVILSALSEQSLVEAKIGELSIFGPLKEVIFHDFLDKGQAKRAIAKRKFDRADNHDRLYNKATFVINISLDEDILWQSMNPDYRRECRRVKEQGTIVEVHETVSDLLLDHFFDRYQKMALERSINIPDREVINRMIANRDLILLLARDGDAVLSMALIYQTGSKAFYMYGLSGNKKNDFSGRYLQWEAIKYLKAQGFHWYDLGGLPEVNEANGIYLFKKRFGGELIDLGTEYLFRPALVRFAYTCLRISKKFSKK